MASPEEKGLVAQSDESTTSIQGVRRLKLITYNFLKDNALVLTTLAGVLLGVCMGLALREAKPSPDVLMWIGMPGELFLRCLKMCIVPLVVSLVLTSTSGLDAKNSGKLALVCALSCYITQLLAALQAIVLFFIFKPDSGAIPQEQKDFDTDLTTQDVFADLLRNIFPDNLVGATISQTKTSYDEEENVVQLRDSNGTLVNKTVTSSVRSGTEKTAGINILGLVLVCTALGIAASRTVSRQGPFLLFFHEAQSVMLQVVRWLFWATPVGVASLIAESVAGVENLSTVLKALGLLMAIVVVGLFLHLFIVLPAALFVFVRVNPYPLLFKCIKPYFIAFASTATSVAIPEMLRSCDLCNVHSKVRGFVIPMTVTIHADGSALYIAASALFLAQVSGLGLTVGNYVVIM